MLKRYRIAEGRIAPQEDDGAQVWVYNNPDDAERRALVERFHVDEHTLASALDPDEVSRLEFEPDHLAIIFKRPKNYSAADNFLFKVVSMGLFLFKDRLVVVLTEDVALFEGKQFQRLGTPQDLMLRLMYRTIFHFLEHLRVITMVSDSLEKKINAAMENRYLLSLFTLEKSLVYYLNAINSNSVVIDRLRNSAVKVGLSPESVEFLDDVAIENQQCYRQAEIYSNILGTMMDARVSIVNNNLSVHMKTLNTITIGIMVPTFVVSAFSMNVAIPMQKASYAFWVIMGMALTSVVLFMGIWRIKGSTRWRALRRLMPRPGAPDGD